MNPTIPPPLSSSVTLNWLIFKPVLRICEHDIGLSEPASCHLDSQNLWLTSQKTTRRRVYLEGAALLHLSRQRPNTYHLSILRLSWLIFLHPPLGQTLDQKNCIDQTFDIIWHLFPTFGYPQFSCNSMPQAGSDRRRNGQDLAKGERVWSSTLAFDCPRAIMHSWRLQCSMYICVHKLISSSKFEIYSR